MPPISNSSSSAGGGGGGGAFLAAPFTSFTASLVSFCVSFPFLSSLVTASEGTLEPPEPRKSTAFLVVKVLAKALMSAADALRLAALRTLPIASTLT